MNEEVPGPLGTRHHSDVSRRPDGGNVMPNPGITLSH
ncbi:hypothetical protein J2S43_007030 [Catenuloplanes nepalensis]|uniref:Uncharacterized protein n=1 Tax=Catenuloplanes nepalensis TaxID=587533 RepID=A0ABT9N490_9ACTN|nr:hypothetical protein [Catenuloplanes nepalensis]